MKQTVIIKKKTGETELFNPEKLCSSLKKSGAPADVADNVCALVANDVKPNMSTQAIFRKALRYLVKEDIDSALRYNLTQGIAQLGPTGFYFEQFVEALLQAHGYKTQRNVTLMGECVAHEADVYAEKDNFKYIIEAKYRNERHSKTHVDQVMYADARLMDIERAAKASNDTSSYIMWVFTNTSFTDTAIRYAECRNLKLVGWNYPEGDSLQDMIMRTRMYPVTALPSVTEPARQAFIRHNIILAQDLLTYREADMVKKFKLSHTLAKTLLRETHALLKA